MTIPTPPDGQKAVEQPPEAHNPWAPPSPESAAAHVAPPFPLPVAQARNGMGIAALVLGIISVVLGLFVILFWVTWLPALLAVVFGLIGMSYARKDLVTSKAMALTGVILGVAGLVIAVGGGVLTVTAVKTAVDDARAKVEEEKAAEASASASASAAEKARHLSFGQTYTFENGLKVTVAKPKPFIPDDFVLGHEKGNKAVQITVTVVNTGNQRIPVETGLPDVNDADGASAELVIDGSGRQKVITGYVLPGKQAVGKYAFSLPPDAADKIEVEFSPDAKKWKDAYWSGPTN